MAMFSSYLIYILNTELHLVCYYCISSFIFSFGLMIFSILGKEWEDVGQTLSISIILFNKTRNEHFSYSRVLPIYDLPPFYELIEHWKKFPHKFLVHQNHAKHDSNKIFGLGEWFWAIQIPIMDGTKFNQVNFFVNSDLPNNNIFIEKVQHVQQYNQSNFIIKFFHQH